MNIHDTSTAGIRRVGYGLEVGRSVRTTGGVGWGHIVSPRTQLVTVCLSNLSTLVRQEIDKETDGQSENNEVRITW